MISHITKIEFTRVCFPSLLPALLRNDDIPHKKDRIHTRLLSMFVTSPLFLFLICSSNYTLNFYETRDNVRHYEFTCAVTGSILISSNHKSQPAARVWEVALFGVAVQLASLHGTPFVWCPRHNCLVSDITLQMPSCRESRVEMKLFPEVRVFSQSTIAVRFVWSVLVKCRCR
jgi:hypothetical protein